MDTPLWLEKESLEKLMDEEELVDIKDKQR